MYHVTMYYYHVLLCYGCYNYVVVGQLIVIYLHR